MRAAPALRPSAARRAAWACALACALLHAPALSAQLRAESTLPRPAAVLRADPAATPLRPQAAPRRAATRSTLGSAALVGAGLATMYLAYDVGEKDGGGFGTYIGVIGAVSFWAGVIRIATR